MRRRWFKGYFYILQLAHKAKKLFSIKARRRRLYGKAVLKSINRQSYLGLREPAHFEHDAETLDSNRANLTEHLKWVELEFSGQPELLLIHAKLIVLIRRDSQPKESFAAFETLWSQETDFLLEHLNLRWLVSANDTFMDFSEEKSERLMGGWTALLVNTVKLTETERTFRVQDVVDARFEQVKRQPIDLFDGLKSFWIGREDTIANMRRRLIDLSDESIPCRIFWEVYARMQEHDTPYARFRAYHEKPRTSWW